MTGVPGDVFLEESIFRPLTIITVYLVFVLRIGKNLMKDRKELSLKNWMLGYNLLQIILNTLFFLQCPRLLTNSNIFCRPANISNSESDVLSRKLHYYYLLLKYLDLCDTIFIVLRKKNKQLSFFHVYHHTVAVVCTWATLKYTPGGPLLYNGAFNAFVHAVMYLYYLMSAWDRSKVTYVKKFVTQIQIIQHALLVIILIVHLLDTTCPYSKTSTFLILVNIAFILLLFINFYLGSYNKHRKDTETNKSI